MQYSHLPGKGRIKFDKKDGVRIAWRRSAFARVLTLVIVAGVVADFNLCRELPAECQDPKEKTATPIALHRADFLIKGASCAQCLLRIEKKLKNQPGIIKASVSIYSPYPAIVIFDSARTSIKDVLALLGPEHAEASNVVDAAIKQVPVVLVPAGEK